MFALLVIGCGIVILVAGIGLLCYMPINTDDWRDFDDGS